MVWWRPASSPWVSLLRCKWKRTHKEEGRGGRKGRQHDEKKGYKHCHQTQIWASWTEWDKNANGKCRMALVRVPNCWKWNETCFRRALPGASCYFKTSTLFITFNFSRKKLLGKVLKWRSNKLHNDDTTVMLIFRLDTTSDCNFKAF